MNAHRTSGGCAVPPKPAADCRRDGRLSSNGRNRRAHRTAGRRRRTWGVRPLGTGSKWLIGQHVRPEMARNPAGHRRSPKGSPLRPVAQPWIAWWRDSSGSPRLQGPRSPASDSMVWAPHEPPARPEAKPVGPMPACSSRFIRQDLLRPSFVARRTVPSTAKPKPPAGMAGLSHGSSRVDC